VRERLAYVLASDGHPGTREHTLAAGVGAAMAAGASPSYARRLTGTNPGGLLRVDAGAAAAPGGRDWRGHGALERVRQARRRLARMR
jgi:protein-tyrosine phosphatase